jgi:hypothetical protein
MGLPLGLFPNWVSLIIQMHTYIRTRTNRPRNVQTNPRARRASLCMFVLHSVDLGIMILFESMALMSEAHSQDVPLETFIGQRHSDNWE